MANEVAAMRFLVLMEARDTLIEEKIPRLRRDVQTAIQRITAAGKLQAGGMLVGRRKGFMVLEADSPSEILELLGGEIVDNMNADVHPFVTFEELGQFFAAHPWQSD